MSDTHQIIIAGGGPAGTAAALGLARLGYGVTVLSAPRSFVACEGISERVVNGLAGAGIRHGLTTIAAPSQRHANWNGSSNAANTERLIRRDLFDQALLQDLEDAGVAVIAGRVNQIETQGDRVTVQGKASCGESFTLHGDFFVEARGRATPAGKQPRLRGPETVSLLQHWQGEPAAAQSAAASFCDGWAWLAQFTDGSRYTQITLAADAEDFPTKSGLNDYFFRRLQQLPEAGPFFCDAEPQGELTARSATAILTCDPIDDRRIRIGDAALAVDPLSGNGIFQALSTALIAPSVINTILRRPDNKNLAQRFYRERVNHAFMRFARMGRDFYRMETRWPKQPFWQQRQRWPDQQPTHEPLAPEQVSVVARPVTREGFITLQEVVITPDQPLGVWHLGGIALAPIVKSLQARPVKDNESIVQRLEQAGIDNGSAQRAIAAWLRNQGLC